MISSFEKYIKAAMDAKKYSVVCEMANIVHSDKNHINIMTYPGRDVRVYKNRDDEVQILCPKNISYVQESNLSKAISTGTIFDNADDVDKYAGFIVKTKMPIDAMTNKGLENPYKLREVVGSTIGVMNEDGEVDVSDADVDNGNNIIDDLLEKDSKEFKDVKNVVDDYLDNEDHEFGYDTDFTYDIQKLREEIQNFKDADISPEDSITDADWDDNWGSSSSIMGDYEDDTPDKDEDDIEVSDDDSESEDPELTFEEYSIMMESGDMFIQEGAIYTLKKIGYNPRTKTFITDIPIDEGSGAKMECKIKFKLSGAAQFIPNTRTIEIPIKDLLGNSDLVISTIKHEEGHFYISLDRGHFNQDFERAEKLVNKYGKYLPDHENAREEYVADKYAADTAGVESMVKNLKAWGFQMRQNAAKTKKKLSDKRIRKLFGKYKWHAQQIMNGKDLDNLESWEKENYEMVEALERYHDDIVRGGDDFLRGLQSLMDKLAYKAAEKYGAPHLDAGAGFYALPLNVRDDNFRKNNKSTEGEENPLTLMTKTMREIHEKDKQYNIKYLDDIREEARDLKAELRERYAKIKNDSRYKNDPARMQKALETAKHRTQVELDNLKTEYISVKRRVAPLAKKMDFMMKVVLELKNLLIERIDFSVKLVDNGVKARIAYIRKYANKPKTESASYRLRDPFFTESYKDTEIGYKFKEECGAGCINANPSAGGNVNVAMEESEPVVPGDPNTVPKPVMSSGSDIQESDSPIETPSVTPPPMNNTADEPNGGKKMKPENPDDLNSSPDTADTHAPVMSAVKMESFQEGFGLLRPKKLKAIDIRSIVSYVTVEMNAIKDSNDQAMLSGYVCSKLELIDFYITVLDTHDDRYVVPHSRQYLVDGQKQLSDLLTQILKIRPINRGDRVWKAIL